MTTIWRRPGYHELIPDFDEKDVSVLLPSEQRQPDERWCPEENASIFSRLLFLYMNGLMRLGSSKHLEAQDVWDVAEHNQASVLSRRYSKQMQTTASPSKYPYGSVWTAQVKSFGLAWGTAGLIKIVHDVVYLSSPFFLRKLLQHIQDDGHTGIGLLWALGLFTCGITTAVLVNQYFRLAHHVSLCMKSSLIQFLYAKCLRLSLHACSAFGPGKLTNLQSNDAAKLYNLPNFGHMIWSAPFQVTLIILALHSIIGIYPALAGFGATLLLVPLSMLTGRLLHRFRKDVVAKTDTRVKLMTEIITEIKAIKLYAWEEPFKRKLQAARMAERIAIRKAQLMQCVNTIMFSAAPILVAISAFGTFSLLGHELTSDVAFPALAYFDLLRFPIIMLPTQVTNFVNARVSLRRLQAFADAAEVESPPENAVSAVPPAREEPAVVVTFGGFSWTPGASPLLPDITMAVPKGALCIVVGEVGCGKSSLLLALLGEMPRIRGSVCVRGSVAYTSQEAWLQNTSVRKNILMDAKFDQELYDRVVDACALLRDFEALPAADDTLVGEKGVTLSGGQKQRIALARACYAQPDVVLLDDPLSAVDAHVGRQLMSEAIAGVLAPATRVLVTHQLQFLPEADIIVKMDAGKIVATGTYEELVASGVSFTEPKAVKDGLEDAGDKGVPEEAGEAVSVPAAVKHGSHKDTSKIHQAPSDGAKENVAPGKTDCGDAKAKGAPEQSSKGKGCMGDQEQRNQGSVMMSIYLAYMRAWGPALIFPILFLSIAVADKALLAAQNFWLSYWSEMTLESQRRLEEAAFQEHRPAFPTMWYMTVFFGFGIVSIGVQATRAVILVFSTLRASQVMHDKLLNKVLTLPMSFFDTQPSGRLANRFTRDVEALDVTLNGTISAFVTGLASILTSMLVVAAITRCCVAVILAPLTLLYRSVQKYFLATQRELKRLDSVAMSPIFTSFSETLSGLATIRAFRKQGGFSEKNQRLLDASTRVWWPIQLGNRWLSVRLEFMGQSVVLLTAVFVSLVMSNSGLAGLALTSALSVVGLLNCMTRQGTALELGMNSVERMVEYLPFESEAPAVVPEHRPPPHWPATGVLKVTNLVVRYRPDLPDVLKGVTFTVTGGQKVGICGRSGCGKSSLLLALYRLVEPSADSMVLDGVDIAGIGLRDLRSKLALVPQDPVIFSGSVRENLDPVGEHTDASLWDSLRKAGVADAIQHLQEGLNTKLQDSSGSLSTGQRQQLCMARVLLKNARVLLMDEATSNMDRANDSLIQSTVRTAFKSCTVLTVAHRLHTIMDSDAVLVLDSGKLVEHGAPSKLLGQSGSLFASLVQESSSGTQVPHPEPSENLLDMPLG